MSQSYYGEHAKDCRCESCCEELSPDTLAREQISALQAQVARLKVERDDAQSDREALRAALSGARMERQSDDALKRENVALRQACKLARPFVEACDWPAHDPMNDPPPFRVQRKEALKALDACK